MKKYALFFVFAFFFCVNSVQAGLAQELTGAIESIYNANFTQANSIIGAFIAAHPNDPAGYLLRGMSNDWDLAVNDRDKSWNKKIMADYQKARMLAEDALETDKTDIQKIIILGNAYMYVSKKELDTGHKLLAGNSLKKSKNLMLEVLEKDPNNVDGCFAIGMFNYFADNVPSGLKWLANLLGFKGSRSTGLQYIKRAAESPNLSQGDAKYLLAYIYKNKEKNYGLALTYNDELRKQYPNNPIFLFDEAELNFKLEHYRAAQNSFENFIQYCSGKPCSKNKFFSAYYFMASSHIKEKNFDKAKPYYLKAVELDTGNFKDRTAEMKLWSETFYSKSH